MTGFYPKIIHAPLGKALSSGKVFALPLAHLGDRVHVREVLRPAGRIADRCRAGVDPQVLVDRGKDLLDVDRARLAMSTVLVPSVPTTLIVRPWPPTRNCADWLMSSPSEAETVTETTGRYAGEVTIDGRQVWSGGIDAKLIADINGPVGFRSDNGSFIFKLFVTDAEESN